jgi:hypothetical protein
VVDHHVQQHGNVVAFEGINGLQQLRLVAVFRGDTAFLVKLAKIEQVIGVIADRIPAGCPLQAGGSQIMLMPISLRLGANAVTSRHNSPPAG